MRPRSASVALGSRKPSVVMSATRSEPGHRDKSACRTRAVVDFPTDTEPAMPKMNGVLTASVARVTRCVAEKSDCVAVTCNDSRRESGR
jgi:hypothetical protein